MGRFGMLQCAANFSNGYGSKNCRKCGVINNESHRMNDGPEWIEINLVNADEKVNFELLYSGNATESKKVVQQILTMWDLGNNRNSMRLGEQSRI